MPSISPSITNSCKSCTARCCRGLAVVLTIPEAKRLLSATGLAPQNALEFSGNVNSKETPHYPLIVQRKGAVEEYFIVLRRRRGIDCAFLQDDLTCGIYADRPHVCRLYPFDLEGKSMKERALCPVKFEKEAGTEATAAQLRADLKEHGKIARAWHAKFGEEAPDISRFSEYFG